MTITLIPTICLKRMQLFRFHKWGTKGRGAFSKPPSKPVWNSLTNIAQIQNQYLKQRAKALTNYTQRELEC